MIKFLNYFGELVFDGLNRLEPYLLTVTALDYDDSGQKVLFYSYFYPDDDGRITVYEIDGYLRYYMEKQICSGLDDCTLLNINVKLDDNGHIEYEQDFSVVYSRRSVVNDTAADSDAETVDYLQKHFLTLAPNNTLILCEPQNRYHYPYMEEGNSGWTLVRAMRPTQHYELGHRKLQYKLIAPAVWRNFAFANNFNQPELLQLPCSISVEMNTDFSEARAADSVSRYNIKREKLYTVKTCIMPFAMLSAIENFLSSPFISLIDSAAWSYILNFTMEEVKRYRIIITSYKWNPTDQQGVERSLEFTFKMANRDVAPELTTREDNEIFNSIFKSVFK